MLSFVFPSGFHPEQKTTFTKGDQNAILDLNPYDHIMETDASLLFPCKIWPENDGVLILLL